jgi:hypothetical protein
MGTKSVIDVSAAFSFPLPLRTPGEGSADGPAVNAEMEDIAFAG